MVDLNTKQQLRLTSGVLLNTYAPCFINGETGFMAVGGWGKGVEVWDINAKESVKILELSTGFGSASTNDILAFASLEGELQLWDVRNWDTIYSTWFEGLMAYSIHLTANSKYLTIAGSDGPKCVVLEIK